MSSCKSLDAAPRMCGWAGKAKGPEKMNKKDLEMLVEIRLREARVLLERGCFQGSYYLLGYAVEAALKACIAGRVKENDFPDRKLAMDSYTHDLGSLVKVAGLEVALNGMLSENPVFRHKWKIVIEWRVDSRYVCLTGKRAAHDLYEAVTDPVSGVLPWVKSFW